MTCNLLNRNVEKVGIPSPVTFGEEGIQDSGLENDSHYVVSSVQMSENDKYVGCLFN